MNIQELKNRYVLQAKICEEIDDADQKSIQKNNAAVSEMYKILEILSESANISDIKQFATLLAIEENKVAIWLAPQMLEKLTVPSDIEEKALSIIKKAASGSGTEAMGFQSWLDDYNSKK